MNESKFQEALAYFERVHKLNGRNEADELLALSQEARCWAKLGNFDKAKSEYIESLALASKLSGSKSLQFASVLTKLGDVQFLAGDYRDAVKNYLAAREIWNLNMLVPTFAVASMDERLGYCYEALADKDAALKYFRKALAKPTPWTVAKFESFIEENGFPPQNLPKQAAKVRNMSDGEFYFSISGVPYIQASSRDKNVVRQIADDVHKVTMDSL
jgi:tetratricopeptide (TPR) repeat protein